MTDEGDDTREQGVEFGGLMHELESEEYPIDQDELLSKYGDREIELTEGTTTLEELLGPINTEEYENFNVVQQSVMNMVGGDAVGRQGYTDRGSAPNETENESF